MISNWCVLHRPLRVLYAPRCTWLFCTPVMATHAHPPIVPALKAPLPQSNAKGQCSLRLQFLRRLRLRGPPSRTSTHATPLHAMPCYAAQRLLRDRSGSSAVGAAGVRPRSRPHWFRCPPLPLAAPAPNWQLFGVLLASMSHVCLTCRTAHGGLLVQGCSCSHACNPAQGAQPLTKHSATLPMHSAGGRAAAVGTPHSATTRAWIHHHQVWIQLSG